jgi:hypothetical protein
VRQNLVDPLKTVRIQTLRFIRSLIREPEKDSKAMHVVNLILTLHIDYFIAMYVLVIVGCCYEICSQEELPNPVLSRSPHMYTHIFIPLGWLVCNMRCCTSLSSDVPRK